MLRWAKILWITLAIGLIFFGGFLASRPEGDIAAIFLMMIWTFPAGHALAAMVGVLIPILESLGFEAGAKMSSPTLVLVLTLMAMVGYTQFFVLIPRLYRALFPQDGDLTRDPPADSNH